MMENKLELKHLAPYLPYGLKGKFKLSDVIHLSIGQSDEIREKYLTVTNVDFFLRYCKPILRPLTDLMNPIKYKDLESISYMELLYAVYEDSQYISLSGHGLYSRLQEDCLQFSYPVINKLIEWHFDVFGLIEKDLAIDINTLNDGE